LLLQHRQHLLRQQQLRLLQHQLLLHVLRQAVVQFRRHQAVVVQFLHLREVRVQAALSLAVRQWALALLAQVLVVQVAARVLAPVVCLQVRLVVAQ
jgi:hypothetical protein